MLLHPAVELLHRFLVVGRVAQHDVAVAVEGDPVVGLRQVLDREPEVDGVRGDVLEGHGRRQLRLDGLLPAVHRRRRLADHLQVAHRVVEVGVAEVVVVEAQRLLEPGVVGLGRDGQERTAVVEDVVATDLVRAVRQTVGVPVVGAGEQQLRRVGGAGGHHDDVAGEVLLLAVHVGDDRRHGAAGRVRLEPAYDGVADQVDVVVLERGSYGDHLGVALGVHQARESVTGGAADACAEGGLGLVEHDPRRGVEGMEPHLGQVVEQPLDARLVRDRRIGVRRGGRWLGGILTAGAVHLVELLGLGVVGLEDAVVDGPGGRDPVMVLQLAEIALPEPVQGGAVELRRPTDEVVDLRLEGLALPVVPAVRRDVPVVDEDRLGVPVLHLARKPVAAFQDQDPLPGRRQPVGEGAAACPRADDDYVVAVAHVVVPPRTPLVVQVVVVVVRRSSSEMWGTSVSRSPQAMRFGADAASTVAAWSRSK